MSASALFYLRRAYRLLPALFAFLAIYLVVSVALYGVDGQEFGAPLVGTLAGIGYSANMLMAAG